MIGQTQQNCSKELHIIRQIADNNKFKVHMIAILIEKHLHTKAMQERYFLSPKKKRKKYRSITHFGSQRKDKVARNINIFIY